MTILVVGATGKVAGQLTRKLLEKDEDLRLLVRNPEKATQAFGPERKELSYVSGSFEDPSVLARAFEGVRLAFLGLGTSYDQEALERGLIDAARLHRTPHVLRLSVLRSDRSADYEVARRHGELDSHLAASGVPHTLLRPAYFTQNLLLAASSIAASGRWFGCIPSGRMAMIDARDVGDAAAAIALDPSRWSRVYDLTGPQAVSLTDIAGMLSDILTRPVEYVATDAATLRKGFAARGVPDWLVDYALGIERGMQRGEHAEITAIFRDLTGRAPRNVEAFLREHRSAFAAKPATAA